MDPASILILVNALIRLTESSVVIQSLLARIGNGENVSEAEVTAAIAKGDSALQRYKATPNPRTE